MSPFDLQLAGVPLWFFVFTGAAFFFFKGVQGKLEASFEQLYFFIFIGQEITFCSAKNTLFYHSCIEREAFSK